MICCSLKVIFGFAALTTAWISCSAAEILECFQCFEGVGTNSEKPLPVCSQLSDSPEFKVLCPNSTMCLKVVHTMNLLYGSKRTTETRGCASQVSVVPVLKGKFYEDVVVIDEPYKDECMEKKSHSMLTSTVQQCYCRGNLCNSATHLNLSSLIKIICVMFLLSNLRLITAI